MNELLEWLVTVEDTRQPGKITRLMKAIIAIVFFAGRANANEWIAIYLFAPANEEPLRNYLELPGEIPSHDTIQRVWAMATPEFRNRWNEIIAGSVGDTVRKIPALDGETRRGKGNDRRKADPIVSAMDTGGFCLGVTLVDDKSNVIHVFVVGHLPGPAH